MTGPLKHKTSHPQVDVQVAGGDDTKTARRGAIFIGLVLIAYIVYLVVTGQMAQFWGAMASVKGGWLFVACFFMFLYLVFGILAYAIAVWLDPNSPVGIRDLISVEASGIFFGNLTPMMMGSTPAQIYRLTKAGQNVGEAGAVHAIYRVSIWPRCLGCHSAFGSDAVFCRALWRHHAAVHLQFWWPLPHLAWHLCRGAHAGYGDASGTLDYQPARASWHVQVED